MLLLIQIISLRHMYSITILFIHHSFVLLFLGKDRIMFVTKEDYNKPSTAVINDNDEEEEPGLFNLYTGMIFTTMFNLICTTMTYKGIRFIVLYPPKCSHDLPPLARHCTYRNHFNPPGDIPEQLAAYSAHTLRTALFMLGTHFAAG